MKLKTLFVAIALLATTTLASANNCIDDLTQTISKFPRVEKVNLNPFLLTMLKPFSSELKGFKSLCAINAEELSRQNYKKVKKILDQCNTTEYETVVSETDADEIARIWIKTDEQYIREIVIIALENDEVSLVRIKGKIDPQQLSNIIAEND